MRSTALGKTLFYLGSFVGVAYLVIAVVGALWPGHWDEARARDEILWTFFLLGGGLALLAGLRVIVRSRWLGALLVSLGALGGALPLFWTVIASVVAVVLNVLGVAYARRPAEVLST